MLKRFPGGPATDKVAERFQLRGVEFPLKLEIQPEAREREGVGEEEFGLQPWRGNPVFGEMSGGCLEDGEYIQI